MRGVHQPAHGFICNSCIARPSAQAETLLPREMMAVRCSARGPCATSSACRVLRKQPKAAAAATAEGAAAAAAGEESLVELGFLF